MSIDLTHSCGMSSDNRASLVLQGGEEVSGISRSACPSMVIDINFVCVAVFFDPQKPKQPSIPAKHKFFTQSVKLCTFAHICGR
jgi:hypothetical protein